MPKTGWPRRLLMTSVVPVLALVAWFAAPGAAATSMAAQRTPPLAAAPVIGCLESPANPHCDRYVADLARRLPVRAADQQRAQAVAQRLDAVMPEVREGPCVFDEANDACTIDMLPPTVEDTMTALRRAGHTTATVRLARADDPAPAGSLLLAVPVGSACLLAYDAAYGRQPWIVGLRLDGTCLG